MTTQDTYVIVFHGTTSAFDKSIQEHGFQLTPERRPSHQINVDEKHLCSFDGTYAALDRDTARHYATSAVEENGGEPRIYALRVPLSAMVPDEDEVHFALSCHLAEPMGFNEMSDENIQYATTPWSIDIARDAVSAISDCFHMDQEMIDQASVHLHAMIKIAVKDWDGDLYFFHPDGNDKGWSSPFWVRKLASLDGGYELYREHMDLMLRCMHLSPEAFPAGFEAFKGRVVEPFGFDSKASGIEIIGYGTIADPFEDYSNFDGYTGTELSLDPYFLAEAQLSRQSLALTG
jgi:hypothetical protein